MPEPTPARPGRTVGRVVAESFSASGPLAPSPPDRPAGQAETVVLGRAGGELVVDPATLARTARRLGRAGSGVHEAILEAPDAVDAGVQTELVGRLLERLVGAAGEVSRGLEAGGRAVEQVARDVADVDAGIGAVGAHLQGRGEVDR